MSELQFRQAQPVIRRNRGRLDVIGDILHICESLNKKTHIMQKANLSTDMVHDYVSYLLRQELLQEVVIPKKKHPLGYRITEKGRWFLTRYREILYAIGENPDGHELTA